VTSGASGDEGRRPDGEPSEQTGPRQRPQTPAPDALIPEAPHSVAPTRRTKSPVTHTGGVLIRIEAYDLPGRSCGPSPDRPDGHHGIEVGVQRKNKPGQLMGQVSADAESVTWELEATPVSSDLADFRGPYISGPPGGRFIYLSWGVVEEPGSFAMFRRAKIMFDGIPAKVLAAAQTSAVLVGRLGLTDPKGNPTCASVRPPLIEWTSAAE
jgi:Family of unknown function (DUF5990)